MKMAGTVASGKASVYVNMHRPGRDKPIRLSAGSRPPEIYFLRSQAENRVGRRKLSVRKRDPETTG